MRSCQGDLCIVLKCSANGRGVWGTRPIRVTAVCPAHSGQGCCPGLLRPHKAPVCRPQASQPLSAKVSCCPLLLF